jgi:acetyltransferase-like isoleucine patch superfamily enzyme
MCALERRLRPQSQGGCFTFWTHVFALVPGAVGMFLRRGFYWWTLERCAESVTIGFGALFSRQNAIMEAGAYVGSYALVGSAWIGENTLIGSRASLLSGGRQHEWLPTGRWSGVDEHRLRRLVIGANTWIGEGAIIMADVGEGCMVAAGAVVSSPVPPGVMVAGNPARFVRRVEEQHERE